MDEECTSEGKFQAGLENTTAQGKYLKNPLKNILLNQAASACQGRNILISIAQGRSHFNAQEPVGQLKFLHLAAEICSINTCYKGELITCMAVTHYMPTPWAYQQAPKELLSHKSY